MTQSSFPPIILRFVQIALKIIGAVVIILILAYIVLMVFISPSSDREWSADQEILPYAEIDGSLITIHGIRDFTYASTTSYIRNYYDKTFDLNTLKKVYYIVEPFAGYKGAAHTFLSFEFEGNNFISISVEIRKEKGESFSALKGLLRQYELMYVIADERDVIKLRSNYRKDLVYVYPMKATPAKARELFLGMIERTNELYSRPEFYNTLTNTCTTNIVRHVNIITPNRIPRSLDILLPADSDKLAFELGLIDTELSFEEARARYLINERALLYSDDPLFSRRIRE